MLSTVAEDDLDLLKTAAMEAGELAMSYYRRNPNSWAKAGGSLVTEADMAVDAFLRQELLAARPRYGWLSEETADDPRRCAERTIFVVDPIDGTRGFLAGDDRWCVSVALVHDGRPAAAVLNAPARKELMTATAGGGAWMQGRRLAVSSAPALAGARLAGPRGWLKTAAIRDTGADLEEHVPSLAYRFASVGAGRFDAAFASPRANDWDIAACDLLVHEAGGEFIGLDGRAPRYNGEIPRHGVLVAANRSLLDALVGAVQDAEHQVSRGGAGGRGAGRR
jgi:myo-inositol-1(or 4)-monophosphatase